MSANIGDALEIMWLKSAAHAVYAVCTGSFDAAFAKCLWPLVTFSIVFMFLGFNVQTYANDTIRHS